MRRRRSRRRHLPIECAVVGQQVRAGDVLADLSTEAERQNVVVAKIEVDASSLLEDVAALEVARHTLELTNARVASHILRTEGDGNIEIIHATRSNRAQSDYFSIVYYSRSR